MEDKTVGFAVCGSFCTHAKAMEALEQVKARFARVVPIVSEAAADTDTRFGKAHDLMREMERICDRRVISDIKGAEPIGPQKLLDLLIIAPCTGNTLGKLAAGVTDTSVTMAAKAHLRNERPVLIAPSTNDGLAASAAMTAVPGPSEIRLWPIPVLVRIHSSLVSTISARSSLYGAIISVLTIGISKHRLVYVSLFIPDKKTRAILHLFSIRLY